MNKPNTIDKIATMRNGGRIKCPKCDSGFVSAVGKPETASLFRCDGCGTGMLMTKK